MPLNRGPPTQRWLLAGVLLMCSRAAVLCRALDPSLPKPKTGALSCLLPIKNMVCSVDQRSGFVAGVSSSYGTGYGFKAACSTGNAYQPSWNMGDTNSTAFPKLPNGQPDLIYYYPYGGLITQIIVLQAANPWGEKFGTIPAIIFAYLTPVSGQLDFAVCGNADYAQFYLNPAAFPPPPTPVVLQRTYVSPLSGSSGPKGSFLGGFGAKCSQRGTGYLGGDPNTSSKYFIMNLEKVCFTELNHVVTYTDESEPPFEPAESNYTWWENIDYKPCYYKPHSNGKPTSPSASCAATGQVIATGKWGAIMMSGSSSGSNPAQGGARAQQQQQQQQGPWEMAQDAKTGKLVRVASKGQMFAGVLPANQGN